MPGHITVDHDGMVWHGRHLLVSALRTTLWEADQADEALGIADVQVAAIVAVQGLTDLIGELVTRSDAFRLRWSAHNVRFHRSGTKRIHHPEVGDLEFTYEGLDLPGSPGWVLFVWTTVPGSPSEERVTLLGSLAVTRSAASTAADPEN